MRYAVYTTTAADPHLYVFSSSYSNKEAAFEKIDQMKAMGLSAKGVVIEVYDPDQKVDPGASHFWTKKEAANV